jgi:hypothetical protein
MFRRLSFPSLRPVLVAGMTALSTTTVLASTPSVSPPVTVSGPSPFATCPFGARTTGRSTIFVNAEVEPRVAVDPSDANHLVGVWQQDRWNDCGSHGLMAATSTNGGATWSQSSAAFDKCEGNTDYDRASDPWVSIGPNGDAHQISLSISADVTTSAVLASKLPVGGDELE